MRGRQPAQKDLKVLRGERPDRIASGGPATVAGELRRPADFNAEVAEEWDRICDELRQLGLLSVTDRALISLYCRAYGRWRNALRTLDARGELIDTETTTKANPAAAIAATAEKSMLRMLAEMGLTAYSRTRVKATSTEETRDALGDFLARRRG